MRYGKVTAYDHGSSVDLCHFLQNQKQQLAQPLAPMYVKIHVLVDKMFPNQFNMFEIVNRNFI